MVELTFDVGQTRHRNDTSYKLVDIAVLDELLLKQEVVSEMTRRTHAIDYSKMKAAEWKWLATVLFPLVIEAIPEDRNERTLWLLFAYVLRAYSFPKEEMTEVG